MTDPLKSFVRTANAEADLRRYKRAARAVAADFDKRMARMRILLMTANRYVEGYAENEMNHPQACDCARDLTRQIKEELG